MAVTGAAKGGGTPPPRNWVHTSQENSWLRRWAKYTKLCMVWQPNILINCYELSGGYAPPNHPPGALPLDPAGGLPFPRHPVPPTSKSWLRHWWTSPSANNGSTAGLPVLYSCWVMSTWMFPYFILFVLVNPSFLLCVTVDLCVNCCLFMMLL